MPGNPLHNGLRKSLEQLPQDLLSTLCLEIDSILSSTPKTFNIYEPLLLLPAHTFQSIQWSTLLDALSHDQKHEVFKNLAISLKVAHIAINSPITLTDKATDKANVQRRPNITPLYGNFGNFQSDPPSEQDFVKAFWVSTRQNGITQVWAPLYTMFSRGNITEKARVLSLPSVQKAVAGERGCTAIDLYAGIGYFAFSYAKAGCLKVLGFELNPWSVEGLRRGAKANSWSCSIVQDLELQGDAKSIAKEQLTIFEMSNDYAVGIVENRRDELPPVRHVNLGLLPSSSQAYETGVLCLDPELGGWLHVHENFAVKDIAIKADAVRSKLESLARAKKREGWKAHLEHVEKVKTYAPGVMHCVLDIHLQPIQHKS